jgi:MarR family 2-MHQ and catechol resistance regulon transcriptional repressor
MMRTQPGTHLWLVLFKAYQAIREHDLLSIESTGLCQSDFATLEALLNKGPMPVNTIGEKILLSSGSITTAVDRLERKGLVERQASPHDRRLRIVHLTPAGETLMESVFERHQQALERATSGVTDAEKQTLITLLKKLGKNARQLLENSHSTTINPEEPA